MDTIVVLELDTPTNVRVLGPDRTPAEPANPVRRTHSAPVEPSGACGPLTLCGLDTSEMALAPLRSAHLRQRWHICGTCQSAERNPAPHAPGPPRPDSPEDDDDAGQAPER
ncbi:hypothetical protein ACFVHB_34365 [Kitasatospora sp. NPDC127111]|uniref:hypothetical protein n=1 Tax=Kitasatospora sp. NPDC127111 TaxID=3345363 RepID=UPI00363B2025